MDWALRNAWKYECIFFPADICQIVNDHVYTMANEIGAYDLSTGTTHGVSLYTDMLEYYVLQAICSIQSMQFVRILVR